MNSLWNRRTWLAACGGVLATALGPGGLCGAARQSAPGRRRGADLTITGMTVTPIALPDPPLLAASGCHGPYFLRNIVQLQTADGIVGIGETKGGEDRTRDLERLRRDIVGTSAFSWNSLRAKIDSDAVYAAVEMACLDAVGRALGVRLCDLLGGAVREEVEFASYLFYRYAADHPLILEDERLVDDRGRGDQALDRWGEVRTPEAMAELAWQFHQKWGFRVHKLKAGVLEPDVELATLQAINERFGGKHPLRIDPNGRWRVETAVRIAREIRESELPLEYYEDPVDGLRGMAAVRRQTGLKLATNSCVTDFDDIAAAVRHEPVDVVLADVYSFGGIPACQSLGTLAEELGWGISQHSNNHAGVSMAAMIHMAAVVPQMNHAGDTHYVWLPDGADIIQGSKLPIQSGRMAVPSGPGLGVDLDADKLARAHEVYRKCGMRDRDDDMLMRRMVPGWKRSLY